MRKSIKKILFITIVMCTCLITGKVSAAPGSVTITSGERLSYIGSTYFAALQTTGGQVVYCLDFWKQTPNGVNMSLQSEGDAGLTYIIQNGYPHRSFTGNASMDKFITASAVWWYLDNTAGMNNLSNEFKTTDNDPHGLRPYIQNLVNNAMGTRRTTASLNASINSKRLKLSDDGKFFESELVNVVSTGISTYTVSLTGAPNGTIITDENGNVKNTYDAGHNFKVRVPVAALEGKLSSSVDFTISGSVDNYKVYKYSTGGRYQPIVTTTVEADRTNVSAKASLTILTTKLQISKKDVTNKKELPGAKLTLRNSNGQIIETWISGKEPHYFNFLPEGTYTLEEEVAPKGYILNKEKITFKIVAQGIEQLVTMYNQPQEKPKPKPTPTPTPTPEIIIEVPKTASSISMIVSIIGFAAVAGGSGLIYYNAKIKK